MRIEHGLPGGPPRQGGPGATVTIGNFDGVHRGHRAILETVAAAAAADAGERGVVTFDPHPRCVLTPDRCPATLTPVEERAALLEAAGVDRLVVLRFDAAMSRWPAAAFCARLAAAFVLRRLVVGHDFALGHDREGDVAFLRAYGRGHGFEVEAVAPLLDGGAPISSSRVRTAVAAGDVAEAARLLGRPHAVTGSVERGEGVGRTLGYPTANLRVADRLALPGRGIYACWAQVNDRWWRAATSIGVRPTFGGRRLVVEPYLLDYDGGDLYGERLRLAFVERLRDEVAYESVEALTEQMGRDVERTREVLAARMAPAR